MAPLSVFVPPALWVMVRSLLSVMAPLNSEELALLPPSVKVLPELPAPTVNALPSVKPPLIKRLALALPVVSPRVTVAALVPKALLALAKMVPAFTVHVWSEVDVDVALKLNVPVPVFVTFQKLPVAGAKAAFQVQSPLPPIVTLRVAPAPPPCQFGLPAAMTEFEELFMSVNDMVETPPFPRMSLEFVPKVTCAEPASTVNVEVSSMRKPAVVPVPVNSSGLV